MPRRLGPFLPLLLVGLLLMMRETQTRAAERIGRGEQRALQVLDALGNAAERVAGGAPRLDELLAGVDAVERFAVEAPPGSDVDYARDRSYVYALARFTQRDVETNTLRSDWLLRAWPLDFGRTGDAEYQLGSDGVLWEGQNLRGRSGTETGFPPPFPEPEIADRPASWWKRPRPGQPAGQR